MFIPWFHPRAVAACKIQGEWSKDKLEVKILPDGRLVVKSRGILGSAFIGPCQARQFIRWLESHYATPAQHETATDAEKSNETDS